MEARLKTCEGFINNDRKLLETASCFSSEVQDGNWQHVFIFFFYSWRQHIPHRPRGRARSPTYKFSKRARVLILREPLTNFMSFSSKFSPHSHARLQEDEEANKGNREREVPLNSLLGYAWLAILPLSLWGGRTDVKPWKIGGIIRRHFGGRNASCLPSLSPRQIRNLCCKATRRRHREIRAYVIHSLSLSLSLPSSLSRFFLAHLSSLTNEFYRFL